MLWFLRSRLNEEPIYFCLLLPDPVVGAVRFAANRNWDYVAADFAFCPL